jgi:hypothetical protein
MKEETGQGRKPTAYCLLLTAYFPCGRVCSDFLRLGREEPAENIAFRVLAGFVMPGGKRHIFVFQFPPAIGVDDVD